MSDAIVLSIDCHIEQSFSKLIGFSSYLIQNFISALEFPVFLRGGITRGKIFHDGSTVFGPGLVGAYTLENEIARSMRCIISESLKSDPSFVDYIRTAGSALKRDPEDGIHFIHFAKPEFFKRLHDYALDMLDSNARDEIKEKYRWLSRYLAEWKGVELA
jgi:hypothetical protein